MFSAAEFRRLGVEGDWADPYTTMAYKAEAQIIREIGKFLMNGSLYQGREAGVVVARREDRVGGSGDRVSTTAPRRRPGAFPDASARPAPSSKMPRW